MKPYTFVLMNQDELPKSKVVIGESMVSSKKDTLFGNTIAIRVSSEAELNVLKNYVNVFSEMLDNVKFE